MKAYYTDRLLRSYGQAPLPVRKAFDKQVLLLLSNIRHPSLRAKKYGARRTQHLASMSNPRMAVLLHYQRRQLPHHRDDGTSQEVGPVC